MKPKCLLCSKSSYDTLYRIKQYSILKCKKCGFVFADPFPSKKEMDAYYRQYNNEMGFFNEKLIRNDAQRTLSTLKNLGIEKGSMFDIGCGSGFFLDEARKKNWQTFGIDTAKVSIEYAYRKLKLDVVQKDLFKFDTKKKFDVIVLIQVIEHLTNPQVTLRKINGMLKKGGTVCIATPNIESFLHKIQKGRFSYLIPPEHVTYYSPKTLQKMLEKNGFETIKTTTYGYPEDFGAIYRTLRSKKSSIIIEKEGKHKKAKQNNKLSSYKKAKSYIFENIVRNLAYPLLNIGLGGSMVEIYAQKK